MISYSSVCYHIDYIRRGCRRVVAELKPPISLAQLPQVLAWHELECAPSVTGLAKLDIEEARAKHAFRLDSQRRPSRARLGLAAQFSGARECSLK